MRAFRFRLQRVLRVREIEEQVALAVYLEAARIAADSERRAASMARTRAREQDELARTLATPPVSPELVLASHATLDRSALALRAAKERAKTLLFQASLQRSFRSCANPSERRAHSPASSRRSASRRLSPCKATKSEFQ